MDLSSCWSQPVYRSDSHLSEEVVWRARQESNPQPLGPKPSALSIELQAQHEA